MSDVFAHLPKSLKKLKNFTLYFAHLSSLGCSSVVNNHLKKMSKKWNPKVQTGQSKRSTRKQVCFHCRASQLATNCFALTSRTFLCTNEAGGRRRECVSLPAMA